MINELCVLVFFLVRFQKKIEINKLNELWMTAKFGELGTPHLLSMCVCVSAFYLVWWAWQKLFLNPIQIVFEACASIAKLCPVSLRQKWMCIFKICIVLLLGINVCVFVCVACMSIVVYRTTKMNRLKDTLKGTRLN